MSKFFFLNLYRCLLFIYVFKNSKFQQWQKSYLAETFVENAILILHTPFLEAKLVLMRPTMCPVGLELRGIVLVPLSGRAIGLRGRRPRHHQRWGRRLRHHQRWRHTIQSASPQHKHKQWTGSRSLDLFRYFQTLFVIFCIFDSQDNMIQYFCKEYCSLWLGPGWLII